MTNRDRIMIMAVAALAVLAAVWFMAVAPKRQQASELHSQVASAEAQLASAEGKAESASTAQAQYRAAYASIVRLGKAVPAGDEVPGLIYQLQVASNRKHVEFASITTGAGAGGASSSSASSSSAASAVSAGFSQMPFTFVFNGSYEDLYRLFVQLNRFTLHNAAGGIEVSGRLLTIQSVKLSPVATSGSAASSKGSSEQLSGTITATAYTLPAGQSLTGGATVAGPAGTAQSTSAAGSGTPATTPALVQVTP
jgi:Tfp pilus assembly protein PilO